MEYKGTKNYTVWEALQQANIPRGEAAQENVRYLKGINSFSLVRIQWVVRHEMGKTRCGKSFLKLEANRDHYLQKNKPGRSTTGVGRNKEVEATTVIQVRVREGLTEQIGMDCGRKAVLRQGRTLWKMTDTNPKINLTCRVAPGLYR